MHYHVRWLIKRDLPEVMDIERNSFNEPWTEEDFNRTLREHSIIGMVAEHGNIVCGFMVYQLCKHKFNLLTMAVHPDWRRCGVGTTMTMKLLSKLSSHRRNRIIVTVNESSLDAQLFFRQQGFECFRTEKGFFDSGADAYVFKYLHRETADEVSEYSEVDNGR